MSRADRPTVQDAESAAYVKATVDRMARLTEGQRTRLGVLLRPAAVAIHAAHRERAAAEKKKNSNGGRVR